MIRWILTCLFGCASLALHGQTTDAEALLVWMDQYASLPAKLDVAAVDEFSAGWLEKVELRTETNRFDPGRQRFAARAQPKLPHIRRAEERLQSTLRSKLVSEDEEAQAEAYSDALTALVEAATDAREIALLDSLIETQVQLVKAARLRLAEPNFDVERVLDADDELSSLRLRQQQLATRLQRVALPISTTRLVDLPLVNERLNLLLQEPLNVVAEDVDLSIIDAEIKLEKAENLSVIDFIQLEYDSGEELVEQKYNVGISVQLPRKPSNIRQLDELKLERLEEVQNLRLSKAAKQRELREAAARIQLDIDRYQALASEILLREARRERLLEVYLLSEQTRPEDLIKLKRRTLRDRLQLLEVEEDIRGGYIRLISKQLPITAATLEQWVLR